METLASLAIKDITEEVIEIFKEDYIDKIAYIPNPQEYSRTMEFKEAWDWSAIKSDIRTISTYLWYDPSKLKTFEPAKFQHGSKYSSPNDIRNNLPAILEGKRSSLWISVSRRAKFWEEFIKVMIDGGKLEQIVTKHFMKQGFTRI